MCHVAAGLATLLALAGCAPQKPKPDAGKLSVFVSIVPQAYLAQRVGGQRVTVEALVQPGQSPHNFAPTTAQMARLAGSRIFFTVGVNFEKSVVAKIAAAHPHLKIVDTRQGIRLRQMTARHDHEHHAEHGHTDEHAPGREPVAPDPHVWLSPRNAVIIARNISQALKAADPAHAAEYEKNLAACVADLKALDARIAAALAPLKGREFMVFHPAFGYFADDYGLKQLPVEIEGKDPDARALGHLIETAKAKKIRIIFVQPQFSSKRAQAVAEAIGGAVVPMDPLARDYLGNLGDMARKIEEALK